MAARWSDEDIAASLNRMGMRTGQGKTWTARRVGSIRKVHGLHAYRSAEKDGEWLTMTEAATKLGVTNHVIRRLIKDAHPARRAGRAGRPTRSGPPTCATSGSTAALGARARPRRADPENQLPMFTDT